MGFLKIFEKLFKRKTEEVRPYIEKDTKCDKCEYLQECIVNGHVINCMTFMDKREHYIVGIGAHCKQDFSMIMSAIKDGVGVPEEINEDLRHYGIEMGNNGLSE